MPKCSMCSHEAESLGKLRQHYKEAGHPTKRKPKRSDDARKPELGSEEQLLVGAVALFQSAGTDSDQDERVLRYLITRYAPSLLETSVAESEDAA